MSRRLVLICERPERTGFDEARLDRLRARVPGMQIEYFDDRDKMATRIPDAEVIAGEISPENLARAGNLRWFHAWAAGPDPFLFPEMVSSPVMMTCSRGNGAIPLAEHAMMLMIMLNRDALRSIRAQQEHKWEKFMHGELNGLTCGIVGLGYSGVDLAEKAKAFHMHVLGMRRGAQAAPFVDEMMGRDQLDEFMRRSDFVVVTAPLTHETRGMIGEAQLRAMKPSAFVICFSRGGIIDDASLLRALNDGWIAGAGLDAHGVEPLPPGSPFWDAPNTIITPHNGASSFNAPDRTVKIFEENLERYLNGEPLLNLVDKAAGY
jgi:phosphoglycerate dehydrogenase-like enzyme